MTDFRYTLSTSSLVALYFMAMLGHSKVLASCIAVLFTDQMNQVNGRKNILQCKSKSSLRKMHFSLCLQVMIENKYSMIYENFK